MPQKPTPASRLFSDLTLDSLLADGLTWTRLIAGPIGASGFATLFTLIGTTILYRELPAEQAGRLAILLALLETVLLISFFGQLTIITRLHSPPEGPRHNWRSDLVGTVAISGPVLLLAAIGASLIYDLPLRLSSLLAAIGLMQLPLAVMVYMLNANRHYLLSNLLLRLPNAALTIPAGLLLFGLIDAQVTSAMAVWMVPLAVILLLAITLSRRLLPDGDETISIRQRLQGPTFLASSLVAWLPEHGLIALAGLLLPPAQLASYAAMAVFLRVFKFGDSIIAMVMTPELIRSGRRDYKRLAVGLSATAVAVGLAVVALGPPAARLIYSGRYEDGLPLIPLLAIAGGIQLFSVLPRSHLAGQTAMPLYRRMVASMYVITGLAMIVSIPLIRTAGVVGIALAVILAQLTRSGVQFLFWFLDRRSPNEKSAPPPTTPINEPF